MRMEQHTVKVPTWTQSEYGEPVATYTEADPILMKVEWSSMLDQNLEGALYQQYEFVGLTKALPAEGSLIDDTYVVGHVEKGRWNRVFMTHAEGKDRSYGTV